MAKDKVDYGYLQALGLLMENQEVHDTRHPAPVGRGLELLARQGYATRYSDRASNVFTLTEEGKKYVEAAQVFLSTYQPDTIEGQD